MLSQCQSWRICINLSEFKLFIIYQTTSCCCPGKKTQELRKVFKSIKFTNFSLERISLSLCVCVCDSVCDSMEMVLQRQFQKNLQVRFFCTITEIKQQPIFILLNIYSNRVSIFRGNLWKCFVILIPFIDLPPSNEKSESQLNSMQKI